VSLEVELRIKEYLIEFLRYSLKIAEINQKKIQISDEVFPELKNDCYYKNIVKKNENYEYFVNDILIDKLKELPSFKLLNIYFSEQPIKEYYQNFYLKTNQSSLNDVQDLTIDILKKILIHYLKLQRNFRFEENTFNRVYKSLNYFLKNFNQDEYIMPLFNFQSDLVNESKKFGDIILRKITDDELRVFSGMIKNNQILDSYKTLSHVVIFSRSSSNSITTFDDAEKEFKFFINTLTLNFKGELDISTQYKNFEHPWKVFEIGGKIDHKNSSNVMFFSNNEYNSLLNFYHRFKKSNIEKIENGFVKLGIIRFQEGLNRNKPVDKIIDYITSLESFYAPGQGDLTRKMSQRASMVLGTTEEEHESVHNFLKFAYGLRSGLVHGEGLRSLKFKGNVLTLESISNTLEEFVRNSIRIFLKLIKAYNGKDKNKLICSEIDASIINRKKYVLLKKKF